MMTMLMKVKSPLIAACKFRQESVSCTDCSEISKLHPHFIFDFTTIFLFNHALSDWRLDEQADILYLYKTVQMDKNSKNNYKELARQMKDAGWSRDNDQCRHQVIKISD